MQTTRKAVRYYIDRDADMPVIRSVPVSCGLTDTPASRPSATETAAEPTRDARTRGARQRLSSIMHGSVRKSRRQIS